MSVVDDRFTALLSGLEITKAQRAEAATRQKNVRSFLGDHFNLDGVPLLIGSYARDTQIRGDRDLDVLLPIHAGAYWTSSYPRNSARLVSDLVSILREHFPRTRIRHDRVAATMEMDDFAVDVVPVVRALEGFWLPDGEGGWKRTNPLRHIELLERRNKEDPALKPLIKLMKHWGLRAGISNTFALELMVEAEWQQERIPAYPVAVARTLRGLTTRLRHDLADVWPEGGVVYRPSGLLAWGTPFLRVDRDARRAGHAVAAQNKGDDERALGDWSALFGDSWPAS
jgi:hypothetical protein